MNANYIARRSPTKLRGSAKVCVLGGGALLGLEQNISKCHLFAIGWYPTQIRYIIRYIIRCTFESYFKT